MARATFALTAGLVLSAAHPVGAETLSLVWNPSVDDVSGYVVYVRAGSDNRPVRHDVGNVLSFTVRNAQAGVDYCFKVAAYHDPRREGPQSPVICGFTNEAPILADPGNQRSPVNERLSLQLAAVDPEGWPVAYKSRGLPPGLSLMESTGFISGKPYSRGRYEVTVRASDGALYMDQTFIWVIE